MLTVQEKVVDSRTPPRDSQSWHHFIGIAGKSEGTLGHPTLRPGVFRPYCDRKVSQMNTKKGLKASKINRQSCLLREY
jgi:hypothetical protein